ncbi:MAG: type IV pilus assembly protein PilM [Pontibacterium sp.]
MFAFFGKKSKTLVGVDIGSSAVKLVALSRHNGHLSLDAYAISPLPTGAVMEGVVQDVAQVSDAIEKALHHSGLKEMGGCVAAVPASAVISKHIELSNSFTELELEDQVRIEADQFIPYPVDEVAIDFQMMGTGSTPELQNILVVACRKSDVEIREEAIAGAGMNCLVVDVDTYATERSFSELTGQFQEQSLVGVVDIGAATLTLNVFKGQSIIYTREQAFGVSELSNAISQHYGKPVEVVEQEIRQGTLNEEAEQMFVLPFRHSISQQVSRALQFFYSSGAYSELARLYLVGGGASIKGLPEHLFNELNIVAEAANPFGLMLHNKKINLARLQLEAPMLTKACGLAMRPAEDLWF